MARPATHPSAHPSGTTPLPSPGGQCPPSWRDEPPQTTVPATRSLSPGAETAGGAPTAGSASP
eukprot:14725363-Heterocapsa_arctica.AAC.1